MSREAKWTGASRRLLRARIRISAMSRLPCSLASTRNICSWLAPVSGPRIGVPVAMSLAKDALRVETASAMPRSKRTGTCSPAANTSVGAFSETCALGRRRGGPGRERETDITAGGRAVEHEAGPGHHRAGFRG